VIAANTDTRIKYIQNHYVHYRADEWTEILGKGKNIRPAEENLRWIGSLRAILSKRWKEFDKISSFLDKVNRIIL
jgi:hypothetical protein